MIVKCKECGTKLDIDEADYECGVPSSTICPLCGEEVSFTIPKPEEKSRKSKASDNTPSEEKEVDSESPSSSDFVYCPECGFKISKEIKICPNCGFPIQHEANAGEIITEPIETNPTEEVNPANSSAPIVTKEQSSGSKWWIGVLIAAIIIVGFFFALKSTGFLSKISDKAEGQQVEQTGADEPTKPSYSSVVITGTDLRLRLGPSTSAETLQYLDGANVHPHKGDALEYLGESGNFYNVDYNGHSVYVSKDYSYASNEALYMQPLSIIAITGSNVNMRVGPSTGYDYVRDYYNQIIKLKKWSTYPFLGSEGDFYMINYNGKYAYVSKYYSHPD